MDIGNVPKSTIYPIESDVTSSNIVIMGIKK